MDTAQGHWRGARGGRGGNSFDQRSSGQSRGGGRSYDDGNTNNNNNNSRFRGTYNNNNNNDNPRNNNINGRDPGTSNYLNKNTTFVRRDTRDPRGRSRGRYQVRPGGKEVHFPDFTPNLRDKLNRPFKGTVGKNPRRSDGRPVPGKPADAESQWFRIEVPHGETGSSKSDLLRSLSSAVSTPLHPVNYHIEGNTAVFQVQGQSIADALQVMNKRLSKSNGQKINIYVKQSTEPRIELDEKLKMSMKEAMGRRFSAQLNVLDLSRFRSDPYLQEVEMFVPLDRKNVLREAMSIIKENIADLASINLSDNKIRFLDPMSDLKQGCLHIKSINLSKNQINTFSELENLRGMNLEEIWLDGNPLCSRYKDEAATSTALRSIFPTLQRYNGSLLPKIIGFDTGESTYFLPPTLGGMIPDVVKPFVEPFIKQYYNIMDSDDRQGLLAAYHDHAVISYGCFKAGDSNYKFDFDRNLYQEQRNIFRLVDPEVRKKYLKRGKINVVSLLSNFPPTTHIEESFVVDVPFFSDVMVKIVLNGIYVEKGGKNTLRAFMRSFMVVPQGGGFVITNDMMQLANVTQEQKEEFQAISKGLKQQQHVADSSMSGGSAIVAPSPAVIDDSQMGLINRLSTETGMNLHFSKQCLDEAHYDYDKAIVMFRTLQNAGQIPPEAFK